MAKRSDDDRRRRRLVTSTVQMDEAYASSHDGATGEEGGRAAPAKPAPAAVASAESTEGATAQAETVPPEPGAVVFGKGDRAWATVEVSEDRMQATLTALALNGLRPSARQLAKDLARAFGLRGTFDGRLLRRLIAAATHDVARGAHVLLQGRPCEPGADGRVELVCVQAEGDAVSQALAADVPSALKTQVLDEVLAAPITAITVGPGDVIARIVPPTQGGAGRDVRGQPVTAPGAAAACEAGTNVCTKGDDIVAEVFGCVRRRQNRFEVTPPVWIDADATHAYIVHFAELRRLPPADGGWITGVLEAAGVSHGIDAEAVASLCNHWPAATEVTAVAVASGTAPVDGVDTHVEFGFDPSKRAGAVRPDGSIDYRERNAVIGVCAGQLIGKVVAATPGQAGADVKGKELPARDGEEKTFSAGANVTVKSEAGTTAFYSDIDGAVNVAAESIEVQPIFTVSGDVDYETGNIDLPMNVEIGGSVKSEFKVRSQGSVIIGGVLEPGCEVVAGGDVVIAKGVFGEKTRVQAKGDVETRLIHNGRVTLGGDLTVGSYIHNALVHAGGSVTVEEGGSEHAGAIVGGEVVAGGGVRAKIFGSATTDRTVVGIGATPDQKRDLEQAADAEVEAAREVLRLTRTLALQDTREEDLEMRRRRCRDEADLERVEAQIAELRAALQARDEARAVQERIETEVTEALGQATVRAKTIFGDVYVDFGGDVSRVEDKLADAEFYLSEDGVRWRPA